jgi:hypothetical protein
MGIEARRALHIGVLLGVSTTAYAAALTGVTALQSAADRALIAARQPTARITAEVSAAHAGLEARLREATDRYTVTARRYADLEPAIGDLESTLDDLATVTERITKSAAGLPTRVALPAVRSAPAPAARPTTHAVTGASGG